MREWMERLVEKSIGKTLRLDMKSWDEAKEVYDVCEQSGTDALFSVLAALMESVEDVRKQTPQGTCPTNKFRWDDECEGCGGGRWVRDDNPTSP
jgi:hypothetical protein